MTTKTATRPTFTETVSMYGGDWVITAVSLTGKRRYGARYRIDVDGQQVAMATWLGGRRYSITEDATDARDGWEFVTPDGGKVADVAQYVGRAAIHAIVEGRTVRTVEMPVAKAGVVQQYGESVIMTAADWDVIAEAVKTAREKRILNPVTESALAGMNFVQVVEAQA